MTAETILLRPPGATLSRRIAGVLALLFLAVLGMAWLALDRLTPVPPPAAALPAPRQVLRPPPANMLPPATVLNFHPRLEEGRIVPSELLDDSAQSALESWNKLLQDRPGSRVQLTLTSPEGLSMELQHRVGAALVRRMGNDDIDPHRIQLVLVSSSTSALSRGDFRATIELGPP